MPVGMTAGMFATTLEVADKVWRRSMRSRVNVGLTSLFNAFLKLFWEEAWSNRFLDLPTSSIGGIQDFLPSLFSLALNRLLVSTRGQRIATIKLGWKWCGVKLASSKILFASASNWKNKPCSSIRMTAASPLLQEKIRSRITLHF